MSLPYCVDPPFLTKDHENTRKDFRCSSFINPVLPCQCQTYWQLGVFFDFFPIWCRIDWIEKLIIFEKKVDLTIRWRNLLITERVAINTFFRWCLPKLSMLKLSRLDCDDWRIIAIWFGRSFPDSKNLNAEEIRRKNTLSNGTKHQTV